MGIFISYDVQHDYERMDLLRKALIDADWDAHGYTPTPGAKTMNEAMMTAQQADALKKADLLIVLLTPNSAKDKMVEDEVNHALKHKIPIVPLLIAPTPSHLIRPVLKLMNPIDATQDYPLAIHDLIENLHMAFENDPHTLAQKFYLIGVRLDYSDTALEAYNKAIELSPDFASAYNNRGHIYSLRGQLDLALSDFTKAIALDAKRPVFRLQRAEALRRMQRYEEALADCNLVLKTHPKQSEAWIIRGNLYREMKEFKQALEAYSQGIALDASSYMGYINRAELFTLVGKPGEAEQDFLKVIELQPNWAEAYRKLGLLYHSMGQHGGAVEMCKLVLQKDPKHPNAQQMQDYIRKHR